MNALTKKAYIKLKTEVYYDTIDLFLRQKIALFESSSTFDQNLSELENFLSTGNEQYFEELLNKISYKIIPKGVDSGIKDTEKSTLVTNYRLQDSYEIKGIEYFIDAPIEIHIISIIWCLECGIYLDKELNPCTYANRISNDISVPNKLFKLYYEQYSKWRDTALKRAKSILNEGQNVALIALDIKRFYYNAIVDWDKLRKELKNYPEPSRLNLTTLLEKIHKQYLIVVREMLAKTHPNEQNNEILPIGLRSSAIISNWILKDFDSLIDTEVNPAYYGRYCDDMLFTLKLPKNKNFVSTDEFIDFFSQTKYFKRRIKSIRLKVLTAYLLKNQKLSFTTLMHSTPLRD